MSLNPDLGHLYHDSEISGEFIAIDAKERLRTREINAREQRHLDFQNNVLTRARDICERSRNWERWNIERQMRCLREKTPSLQHSLAQEASKLRRYERMMQEVYGSRSPFCQHPIDKQSQGGAASKKVVLKVPFANVSYGRRRKDGGANASFNGAVQSSSSHVSSGKDAFGHAISLQSKSGKTADDSNITFGNAIFLGAGKDGTDFLSRNSVFVDAGQRNEGEDNCDDEALRYGKDHYSPTAMLARPRNLRRRNERVVRSLLRLYHRVDDRKREQERAHSEGGVSREAILEHALVVLRGTPDERMVERLLAELRFGASSPRRHMSDGVLGGSPALSLTPGSSSPRRRNTEDSSDSQVRFQKFRRKVAHSFAESHRKPSESSASGDGQDRCEKHHSWGQSRAVNETSADFPTDDVGFHPRGDVYPEGSRREYVFHGPTTQELYEAEALLGKEGMTHKGKGDERETHSKTPVSAPKLPAVADRHE